MAFILDLCSNLDSDNNLSNFLAILEIIKLFPELAETIKVKLLLLEMSPKIQFAALKYVFRE